MPNTKNFRLAGQYHNCQNELCQDEIYIYEDNHIRVAVLCDGAGSSPYGKEAAGTVSYSLGSFLSHQFGEMIDMSPLKIHQLLIRKIVRPLKQFSRDHHIPIKLLATTIIAIASDQRGHYIALHLGDGNIWWFDQDRDEFTSLSSPANRGQQPYLTMNCYLPTCLRIYRWKDDSNGGIVMMTDGMSALDSEFIKTCIRNNDFERLNQKIISLDLQDDCSYTCLL